MSYNFKLNYILIILILKGIFGESGNFTITVLSEMVYILIMGMF